MVNARLIVKQSAEVSRADLGEQASQAAERELLIGVAHVLSREEAEKSAVQRKDEKTQEVLCIDCGHPIPPKRLAAKPHATRCCLCQTISEGGVQRPAIGFDGPRNQRAQ